MLDAHAHWPSGARDTTEFPKVEITIDASFREHLAAFLRLNGIGWNDYEGQREQSGQTVANSRMRTNRKMYERMGVIYKDSGTLRLSRLGLQMKALEHDLDAAKEQVLPLCARRRWISLPATSCATPWMTRSTSCPLPAMCSPASAFGKPCARWTIRSAMKR